MSRFTLYRVDVDSPRLARLLGTVPGVAVAGEETPDGETAAPATPAESEDDGGIRERIPVPDTDVDGSSAVKTYGLLGLGVSMVLLGIATVGIWVYRRRTDGGESETPPPSATGLDTGETTPSPVEPSASVPATDDTASDRPVAAPGEAEEVEAPEPPGRTEDDRSDVEWTTRDTTPPTADEPPEQTVGEDAADEDEHEPRPTESVDAAPLLGAAFLAVSGAVVKWLQSSGDDR